MKYFKAAFLHHWNLLAFLGGMAFSMLSGQADVLLPLVAAGEIGYLGLLGSHPKFRAYVDAQEAKTAREESVQTSQQALRRIVSALPREFLQRYESLRSQCAELRQISLELKQPGMAGGELPLEGLQSAGLDRLLWIYLRLLYTQYALSRFLDKTREDDIRGDIARLEGQLKLLPAEGGPQQERIRKALEDNLQTSRARLDNVTKARDNYQLVRLEIDRLQNKIRSLSEMAVNRQEPEFISSEVDHVAASMVETERTMNELEFATGLESTTDEAPPLLESPLVRLRR